MISEPDVKLTVPCATQLFYALPELKNIGVDNVDNTEARIGGK